jgi:ABC-type branched-subunit amino acid transport system ATPase component
MLELENLEAGYDGLPVLFGVSFRIAPGESLAILGSNGAGKSTLLKAIIGTVPITGGELRFGGRRLNGMPTHLRVAAGLAFSPEGRRVFPNLTVFENLLVGAQGVPTSEVPMVAETIYEIFPILGERQTQRAATLSGGEAQMLAIGRALMSRPSLLLIEEPSQGVAPIILDKIYDTLRLLCERGLAVLLVEQYQKYRYGYADTVLELSKGQLVAMRRT